MVDNLSPAKKMKKDEDEREHGDNSQASLEEASVVQVELEELTKQMMSKILSVVQEYVGVKRPLYNRRQAALTSVPHFWAIAFMNHPKLKLLVDSSVEDCFNYLLNMQVVENDDVRSGYQIVFVFDANPYFYNGELIKHSVHEDGALSSLRTTVDWKENMNLSGERRRRKHPPVENFFDWLQRSGARRDFVCDIIKDDLWPDPLKYYLVPDEGHSDSESEDEEDYDDVGDSHDDDSNDDDAAESEECRKHDSDSMP